MKQLWLVSSDDDVVLQRVGFTARFTGVPIGSAGDRRVKTGVDRKLRSYAAKLLCAAPD